MINRLKIPLSPTFSKLQVSSVNVRVGFSASSLKSTRWDISKGHTMDDDKEVLKDYGSSTEKFNSYFDVKASSIKSHFNDIIRTGKEEGMSEQELEQKESDKQSMLDKLDAQKRDILLQYSDRISAEDDRFSEISGGYSSSSSDIAIDDEIYPPFQDEHGNSYIPSSMPKEGYASDSSAGPSGDKPSQDSSEIQRTDFTDYTDDLD